MAKSVYEQIKKQNGERFAKAIRGYDNGIFEIPGIVDIVKYAGSDAEPIMKYLESLKRIQIEETGVYQDPITLLDKAGYDAYYVTNLEEQNRIQKYYADGEKLCTFHDPHRFENYHIVNAVRKDVDQIRRKDFSGKEEREDEYGTSVISIQILKTGGFISIKNRYNHTVENPDNTFGSNPDNIILGLSNSLRHHFGTDFSAQRTQLNGNYTLLNNRIIHYNYEQDNVYFGSNFYVKDGEIYHLKDHEIMLDTHIFDMRTKTLSYPPNQTRERDFAFEETFGEEIKGHKVVLTKDKEGQHLFIRKEGEKDPAKDIEILTVKDGAITSLNLPTTKRLDNYFMTQTRLKSFNAPALLEMGWDCFRSAPELKKLSIPHLREMSSYCFQMVRRLETLDAPELLEIRNSCFHYVPALKSINMPKIESFGYSCFAYSAALESVNLPNLGQMGRDCFNRANSLEVINLPKLWKTGNACFAEVESLKKIYAPQMQEQPSSFGSNLNSIRRMVLWVKRKQKPDNIIARDGISGMLRSVDPEPSKGISAQLSKSGKKAQNTSFFKRLRDWLFPRQ